MPEFVNCMTFSELKKMVAAIEKDPNVTDETKVMLDTGWDSLQEILPGSVTVETAQTFEVQDELTKEFFCGYVLAEKSEKFDAVGDEEAVIVIKNLY
ncbi:hypothetical protein [Enterococcus casseliflavus]|uniref:hypothetical protein n=1 Tax=Enterococcus casseliflavus TaxID=37734 RepID=UPI0022FD9433|nr:hypothetical protein [Enterococcus casseliflavus]WBY93492.1 hypothetical protein PEZ80_07215 [Enterococcus casseliflavus]